MVLGIGNRRRCGFINTRCKRRYVALFLSALQLVGDQSIPHAVARNFKMKEKIEIREGEIV